MSSTTLLKTDNSDNTLDHLNENFDDESKTLIPKQPHTSPSLRSDRTSEEVSSPPSSTHSSPQTVEIHPLDTNNESASHTRESMTQSFHTAPVPLPHTTSTPITIPGSQSNSINVDLVPEHLIQLNTGMHCSWSAPDTNYCQVCQRNGHNLSICIWRNLIVWGYCMEIGHGRRDCPTLHRNRARYNPEFNFCNSVQKSSLLLFWQFFKLEGCC